MSEVPEVAKTVSRVRSWIENSGLSVAAIAEQSGVDEKIIRFVKQGKGNPTVKTLQNLETIIPADWREGDPMPPKLQPGDAA